MCGITGVIEARADQTPESLEAIVRRMARAIRHRGPDSEGFWLDAKTGVAFGHRRLAIIDLSPAGHQPMISASGRYVLVFNGEIYNYRALQAKILQEDPSISFRGHSDTEVMLAAFEHWGIQKSLEEFNGMFAFALWDRELRVLVLARDRLGEKPIYYGQCGSTFLFGSELKAIRQHPAFDKAIDRTSLAAYFRFNCIPGERSIYHGIRKLPPGCWLEHRSDAQPVIRPYWDLEGALRRSYESPFLGSQLEALQELDALLRDSVRMRMLSDVPLGAFLSGGIDSSTIAALMQTESRSPVRTFSIGFAESDFDESAYARQVAAHLGTQHTEIMVSPEDARNVIPLLPQMYDEPFGDSSQIPTYLVAKMTRQHVTVALSGDGGDELFGGYNRHLWISKLWKRVGRYPRGVRRRMSSALSSVSPDNWDRLLRSFAWALPNDANQRTRGEKLHKIATILGASDPFSMYARLLTHSPDSGLVLGASSEQEDRPRDSWPHSLPITEQMMFLDTASFLPDDILVKVDRAAMAVSLEGRVPFLDHRVVEFAWSLPIAFKIQGSTGKWILRELLSKYVPRSLFERPKSGFAVPLADWLRGPLRDWAEGLISENRLCGEGFLDPKLVRRHWSTFLKEGRNLQFHLWDIFMFQAWLESFNERSPVLRCADTGECR